MANSSDQVNQFVQDFKVQQWKSEPFQRAMEIAIDYPDELPRLIRTIIAEIPKGGTFLDAVLSFLPLEAFPAIVQDALTTISQNRENDAAQAVIAYSSVQCLSALHPHLPTIFHLVPNAGAYYENWPWRDSDRQNFDFLRHSIQDTAQSASTRAKAWLTMLETRHPEVMSYALAQTIELPHEPAVYLHEVGHEFQNTAFRQLYTEHTFHLIFDRSYFPDEDRPPWLRKMYHPTWQLESSSVELMQFGGMSNTRCALCQDTLHHLITLNPVPEALGITGLNSLSLVTCLSCLGWEQEHLFYQHTETGDSVSIGYNGISITPQFPATPLRSTQVRLVETPRRWHWQDWALSNGRENLHRIGGYPCWIQSAEFLQCPQCQRTMPFLMQLDSDIPTVDGGEWLWGSGGICYVSWCNTCNISGFTWQCT